jgi:lipopolysaccharide export LptBFGC system permease protein LptF
LTFLRMGTDRELIALRAGGLGVYRFHCWVFSVAR